MSDGLENASGGFTDLDELARTNTLIVVRIKEIHPEEVDAQRGFKSNPVTGDLLICSGERAGEVVRGMKIKKGGVTATLRRSSIGKDVAGVMVVSTSDKRDKPFAAMNPCDSVQLDAVKQVYRGGAGFDDNSGLSNAAPKSAPAASAPAGDTPPPF
jgi:hypothetical protein